MCRPLLGMKQWIQGRLSYIRQHEEELVEAFLAKYHLDPSDCEIVFCPTGMGWTFSVRKKLHDARVTLSQNLTDRTILGYLPPGTMITRWTPCSERLPEMRESVLFSERDGVVRKGWRQDSDGQRTWYWHIELDGQMISRERGDVTHWTPLPEPPRKE